MPVCSKQKIRNRKQDLVRYGTQNTGSTSLCTVYQAFLEAFSDYEIPMEMSFDEFESRMKRNGLSLDVSVGAYD